MTNVVRLVGGGTLQVRTGVLQGVGPQGPRGLSGPPGAQGNQGNQGAQGPAGSINQLGTKATVGSATTLSANTSTLVQWQNVVYDDLTAATTSTNFTLTDAGDYMVTAFVGFADPGSATGSRQLKLLVGSTDLYIVSQPPVTGDLTYLSINWTHRAAAGDVLSIRAKSSQALNITVGSVAIERVGSGPAGPQGPDGPQGPQGPQGVKGDKGDAGSASSGFATYADLL